MASSVNDSSSSSSKNTTTNDNKRIFSSIAGSHPVLMPPSEQQQQQEEENNLTPVNPQYAASETTLDTFARALECIQSAKKRLRLGPHFSGLDPLLPQHTPLPPLPPTRSFTETAAPSPAALRSFPQPDDNLQPLRNLQDLNPTVENIPSPKPGDIVLKNAFFRGKPHLQQVLDKSALQYRNSDSRIMKLHILKDTVRSLRCVHYPDPRNSDSTNNSNTNADNDKCRFLVPWTEGYQEASKTQVWAFVAHQLRARSVVPPPFRPLTMNPSLQGRQSEVDPFFVCFSKTKREFFASQQDKESSVITPFQSYCQSQEFIDFCQQSQLTNVTFRLALDDTLVRWFIETVSGDSCGLDQRIGVVFHGTALQNIDPILQNGLNPNLRRRQAHGPGEYFSTNPGESLTYARGGNQMLVFAVVLPTQEQLLNNPAAAKMAHRVGASRPVVVENNMHELPLGVISWEGSAYSRLSLVTGRRTAARRARQNNRLEVQSLTEKLQSMVIQAQNGFKQKQQQQQQQEGKEKDANGDEGDKTVSTTWHGDQHIPERRQMISLVTAQLQKHEKFNFEWLPKLAEMAKHVEELLYLNATSHNEYSKTDTVNQRLRNLLGEAYSTNLATLSVGPQGNNNNTDDALNANGTGTDLLQKLVTDNVNGNAATNSSVTNNTDHRHSLVAIAEAAASAVAWGDPQTRQMSERTITNTIIQSIQVGDWETVETKWKRHGTNLSPIMQQEIANCVSAKDLDPSVVQAFFPGLPIVLLSKPNYGTPPVAAAQGCAQSLNRQIANEIIEAVVRGDWDAAETKWRRYGSSLSPIMQQEIANCVSAKDLDPSLVQAFFPHLPMLKPNDGTPPVAAPQDCDRSKNYQITNEIIEAVLKDHWDAAETKWKRHRSSLSPTLRQLVADSVQVKNLDQSLVLCFFPGLPQPSGFLKEKHK